MINKSGSLDRSLAKTTLCTILWYVVQIVRPDAFYAPLKQPPTKRWLLWRLPDRFKRRRSHQSAIINTRTGNH